MHIGLYLPFRIAESRGSTKVGGNLRLQLADLDSFGIVKQKEVGIFPFGIAESRGLMTLACNLTGYCSVSPVKYVGSLVSSDLQYRLEV